MESVYLVGRAGQDSFTLVDTAGDDWLNMAADELSLTGSGIYRGGQGFEVMRSIAREGGFDQVSAVGTALAERLIARPEWMRLVSNGIYVQAFGYDLATAEMGAGFDSAILIGSDGDDQLDVAPGSARFTLPAFAIELVQLERTTTMARGGEDRWSLRDSSGTDRLFSQPGNTLLVGPGYDHRGYDLEEIDVVLTGANDEVFLSGSTGSDVLTVSPDRQSGRRAAIGLWWKGIPGCGPMAGRGSIRPPGRGRTETMICMCVPTCSLPGG